MRKKWKELVEDGVAYMATRDYYKDVEEIILWADSRMKRLEKVAADIEGIADAIRFACPHDYTITSFNKMARSVSDYLLAKEAK